MIRESLVWEVKKTRMRTPAYALALLFAAALSACAPTKEVTTTNVTTNSGSTKSTLDHGPVAPPITSSSTAPDLPVATSHGTAAVPAPAAQGDSKVDTSSYDARIKQAETKAKSTSATEADKRAAAAAYLERANLYYTAQQPSLYKFALGDFRTVLKYDPSNEEARAKMEQIVSIYQSMGRPIPTNGLER